MYQRLYFAEDSFKNCIYHIPGIIKNYSSKLLQSEVLNMIFNDTFFMAMEPNHKLSKKETLFLLFGVFLFGWLVSLNGRPKYAVTKFKKFLGF